MLLGIWLNFAHVLRVSHSLLIIPTCFTFTSSVLLLSPHCLCFISFKIFCFSSRFQISGSPKPIKIMNMPVSPWEHRGTRLCSQAEPTSAENGIPRQNTGHFEIKISDLPAHSALSGLSLWASSIYVIILLAMRCYFDSHNDKHKQTMRYYQTARSNSLEFASIVFQCVGRMGKTFGVRPKQPSYRTIMLDIHWSYKHANSTYAPFKMYVANLLIACL